jgi:hypothetical protein
MATSCEFELLLLAKIIIMKGRFKMLPNVWLTKWISFLMISFSTCTVVSGQTTLTITGSILDSESQKPIEYASLGLHHHNLYAISNAEGLFTFHVPRAYLEDSVRFSHVGYESLSYSIRDLLKSRNAILLPPKVVYLTEIVVTDNADTSAKEIVRNALKNIDNNYPLEPFILDAYFRKYQKVDGTYVSFLDAAVKLYDQEFTSSDRKKLPEAVLVEAVRKSHYLNFKPFRSWVDGIAENSNWLARLLKNDDVRYQDGLLDKKNDYRLIGNTFFNNEPCFEVEVTKWPRPYVEPNDSSTIRIVIGSKDYKIYRIVQEETADRDSPDPYMWQKSTNDSIVSRISGGRKILEFKALNGKLYLNSFRETNYVDDYNIRSGRIAFENEYTWELQVVKVTEKADDDARARFNFENTRDNFKVLDKPYNPIFWKSYNVIPFTAEIRKAFKDLSKATPIEKQFSEF